MVIIITVVGYDAKLRLHLTVARFSFHFITFFITIKAMHASAAAAADVAALSRSCFMYVWID